MIRVSGLSMSYGDNLALQGVDFSVEPGEVCGYLGPNGAGKSTTVRILTGTQRPTAGKAVVAGYDVVTQAIEVKKRIGYVPETGAVYSTLTAGEYLSLVAALHDMDAAVAAERASSALRLFEIEGARDKRLDTLSKGMRQKVVISAALLHDPEVLLFDEPLSGLDANAANLIKDILRGLAKRGKTILFCSHMLDVVERLCDRVIILDKGKIAAEGPVAEVMHSRNAPTLEAVFRSLTASADQPSRTEAFLATLSREKS